MGSQFQLLSGFLTLILPFKKKRKKHLTEALYPRADSTIPFIFARCIVATVTYLVDEELKLENGGCGLMVTVAVDPRPSQSDDGVKEIWHSNKTRRPRNHNNNKTRALQAISDEQLGVRVTPCLS